MGTVQSDYHPKQTPSNPKRNPPRPPPLPTPSPPPPLRTTPPPAPPLPLPLLPLSILPRILRLPFPQTNLPLQPRRLHPSRQHTIHTLIRGRVLNRVPCENTVRREYISLPPSALALQFAGSEGYVPLRGGVMSRVFNVSARGACFFPVGVCFAGWLGRVAVVVCQRAEGVQVCIVAECGIYRYAWRELVRHVDMSF